MNNKKIIIAFIGFKQVGKSTAAKYLKENYGYKSHNFKDSLVTEMKENFPDLLKEIQYDLWYTACTKTDDWDQAIPSIDYLFNLKPPLMRALMQNYGTDVRRKGNKNYWVKQWRDSLPDKKVVVDDVRFLNEAECVQANGGVLIRLVRPDIETGGEHKSETEQLHIKEDYTISAEKGDHEALYRELDKIMQNE
jgi:hypothetical protein